MIVIKADNIFVCLLNFPFPHFCYLLFNNLNHTKLNASAFATSKSVSERLRLLSKI